MPATERYRRQRGFMLWAPARVHVDRLEADSARESLARTWDRYLADARNWPRWPIVNVLAIEATTDPAWWKMTTPRGTGELRIRGDAATGLLDHDIRDPQAAWTVPARVVPNGRGAEFLITFFQPPVLDDGEFDRQVTLVDTELATLKDILENRH